ncbi:MAG TPA: AEC family transporter [Epulopiscium sp.]|nr:AEC family transporter [Candidatus Epulonipiscium sp.]
MSPTTQSVLSLFFMILVGFYGNKKKIITYEINKGLRNILIQIALPFMIVTSFIFTYDKRIVGFPILMSIYGSEGVVYGSIFNMFFVVFLWTYGVMLFEKNLPHKNFFSEAKKMLLNPSIIAVFIGIIIMIFHIQLPSALLSPMTSIGNMTGPLSMIIIGGILAHAKITDYLGDWTIYYGLTTKLLIIPLIIYFIFSLLGNTSIPINSVILMTAMPASAMTSIFAQSFDTEPDYAAVLVSLTTLLSLITIPLLLKIIVS